MLHAIGVLANSCSNALCISGNICVVIIERPYLAYANCEHLRVREQAANAAPIVAVNSRFLENFNNGKRNKSYVYIIINDVAPSTNTNLQQHIKE